MLKRISPTWRWTLIAVLIFMAAGAIYFFPAIQGKTLEQGDITQFRGSASEIIQYREEGRQVYWTNTMFSGMPNYAISVVDWGGIMRFIPGFFGEIFPAPLDLFFLTCIGFFILMLSLKTDIRTAIIFSLAYSLSSYFIIILSAGHNAKLQAMAYLPGVLAGLIWTYRGHWLKGAAVFGLFLSLELQARHPQMFYYFVLTVVLFYLIYQLVMHLREKKIVPFLKASFFLLIAAILAVGTQWAYLKRTLDYSPYSTRGKSQLQTESESTSSGLDYDYITHYSFGVSETFSWLVPNFKGGISQPISNTPEALSEVAPQFRNAVGSQSQYWGDQSFGAGAIYFGVVVLLLALYALVFVTNPIKYALLAAIALATMLSWGKFFPGLSAFFIEHVPLYNKFRAVNSIIVIPSFCVPVLAAMGLNKMITQPEGLREKSSWSKYSYRQLFYILSFALIGVCLLFYISPSSFNTFLSDTEAVQFPAQLKQAGLSEAQSEVFLSSLEEARIYIFKADVLRSIGFLSAGLLLFWLWQTGRFSRNLFIILLGLIIVADIWSLDKRYLNENNFVKRNPQSQFGVTQSTADEMILKDQDPSYRVLNLTVSPFNDATTSFFHKSIGGYSGIKLETYQEIIDRYLAGEIQSIVTSLNNKEFRPRNIFSQTPVLNALNTKYVIVNRDGQPLQNPLANGNAWFVRNYQVVESANDEIQRIGTVDLKNTAVVRSDMTEELDLPKNIPMDSAATIELVSYDPEKMVYKSSSAAAALAVFSEVYYPEGWRITIDGQEVPLLRADYILRAVPVPAGEHEIVMEFKAGFGQANVISLISAILLLGLVVFALIKNYTQNKNSQGEGAGV